MEKYFASGEEVVVFGKVRGLKPRTIDHPESEVVELGEETSIHLGRIVPIYPLTEDLPQRWLRSLIWRTLEAFKGDLVEPFVDLKPAVAQPGPERPAFLSRAEALKTLHFPARLDEAEPARQRLALDELLELQVRIQRRRQRFQSTVQALPCGGDNHLIRPFLKGLGFKLTGSQTAVLREMRGDMAGAHPMRRLLQGDVGSGKTVVAACCALMALESGFDVALMAPTEILAEQHFGVFSRWFHPLNVRVELRTGSSKSHPSTTPARDSGVTLHLGTHALIQEGFAPEKLGLVIIDEQHRFGVSQREELVRKGRYPHLLVMTATPIPRTLGLTLYGDLDVSVIAELPAGRGQVNTVVRTTAQLPAVYDFVRGDLGRGRQAYIVCPRVEDAEPGGIKAVVTEFDSVKKALTPYGVGLLHGRMTAAEKNEVMEAFRANRTQVMVATSLIEVGVDVPNATLMVVQNAEVFGLAQLHQMRGRIGRGAHNAHCFLIGAARTLEARRRLQVLAETDDGFRIAEADLELRGPGELLGQEQSGMPRFRFADLRNDLQLVHLARELARDYVSRTGSSHDA
jgi:ATP-dependent DNA helicase RecG